MKLDKAIELKQLRGDLFLKADPDDLDEADRLTNEAAKAIIALRAGTPNLNLSLLPGETQD